MAQSLKIRKNILIKSSPVMYEGIIPMLENIAL